jgi:hypothetical protein
LLRSVLCAPLFDLPLPERPNENTYASHDPPPPGTGSDMGAPLPSVLHTFMTLAACLLFMEAVFYWTHRMQHLPALYQRFHKKVGGAAAKCVRATALGQWPSPIPSYGQHHEYRGPIGFAVEYATPGDDIISNYSSTFLLPVVLGVHPVVWLLWIGFRLLQTYETHSGYGTCARFPHPCAFCKPGWRTDCELLSSCFHAAASAYIFGPPGTSFHGPCTQSRPASMVRGCLYRLQARANHGRGLGTCAVNCCPWQTFTTPRTSARSARAWYAVRRWRSLGGARVGAWGAGDTMDHDVLFLT